MKTLTIKLASPLQSYGNEANFTRRTTYDYPSKSAILGMIAAALGYRRNDPRINKLNQLQFAVRVDQPGKPLTDFQIVQNPNPKKNTISYRYYWQDAIYIVAISGDNQTIEKAEKALHAPKFQLFLGRRANPPAGPLETKIYEADPIQVLKHLPWQAHVWFQRKHWYLPRFQTNIICDYNIAKANYLPKEYQKDLIGSFSSKYRWHKYRPVTKFSISLTNPSYKPIENDFYHAI